MNGEAVNRPSSTDSTADGLPEIVVPASNDRLPDLVGEPGF
jgi:hypothetical protein